MFEGIFCRKVRFLFFARNLPSSVVKTEFKCPPEKARLSAVMVIQK
jgi:hypothetical protein